VTIPAILDVLSLFCGRKNVHLGFNGNPGLRYQSNKIVISDSLGANDNSSHTLSQFGMYRLQWYRRARTVPNAVPVLVI